MTVACPFYYQWPKAVQELEGAVYVASEAKEYMNPTCLHQGQPYTLVAVPMVTVPECRYGPGCHGANRLVARPGASELKANPWSAPGIGGVDQ